MADMPTAPRPVRVALIFRGEPPTIDPDPWSAGGRPRIVALAQAIASSPGWSGRPPAALVVREGPDAAIAAIGRFADDDLAWLAAARGQAEAVAPWLRWLDPAAAEAAVGQLADALVARFGLDELRRWRYAAVPRGGLFVLATLAYLLDLPASALGTTADDAGAPAPVAPRDAASPGAAARRDGQPAHEAAPPPDATPLVVVDDIALSGLRLSQQVRRTRGARLVVATLHAHPDLRHAFLAAHPRVTDFVSAIDLVDHAPTALASEHVAWRDRWRDRLDPDSLWIGQPDHVAYPWNEPDLSVWNPVAQREEHGWPLVPPDRCLKRQRAHAIPVQRSAPPRPGAGPHPSVIAGELHELVVLANLETGAAVELDEVGSSMWRALVARADPRAAAAQVAAAYGADERQVAADLHGFVAELVAAGWWREASTR